MQNHAKGFSNYLNLNAVCCNNTNGVEEPQFSEVNSTTPNNGPQSKGNNDFDDSRFTNELPVEYQSIFQAYPCFNRMQSQILDTVLYSDESIVVSAPTGSGKTVIFELAMVKLLNELKSYQDEIAYKMIYISPLKYLCEERLMDWHKKFSKFNTKCITVTGDNNNFDLQHILSYNLIITTPEKWDSLTRKWKDNKKFFSGIRLFMIDEVHLLNEDCRGPTLEAILSRMKIMHNYLRSAEEDAIASQIRFIAVSATIPNANDIAEWLSTPQLTAKAFKFGDDMRPVKLKKVVLGYYYNPEKGTAFKFDLMLNYKLRSVMLQYAEGKPTLIFCSTRKNVELTANYLSKNVAIVLNPPLKEHILNSIVNIKEPNLKQYLANGIGFHHAGLALEDRQIVEGLFHNAQLPILVITSSLDMGVNLRAHLVIIKSTKYYSNKGYKDYSESMLSQLMERAGRPQLGTTAIAVVLTTLTDKDKYEKMIGREQPVESQLHKHLAEHLNSEIVLGTMTDLGIATQWLTSTFLHIRAQKNPQYYKISPKLVNEQIDKTLLNMYHVELNRLVRNGMLVISENNVEITPTNAGILMAKYCIALETMTLFSQVTGKETLREILSLISKSQEFSDMLLQTNDKKHLNLLIQCPNKENLRFPFNGKIRTLDMKVNCIIQATLGCLPIIEQSLVTDSQKIMRTGEIILNCLTEYLKTKSNCYSALLSSLILSKCFRVQLWENSPYVSKQLTGIGSVFSRALASAGKTTFKSILEANPRNIEKIINRMPLQGNVIQTEVQHLPIYQITFEEILAGNTLRIMVKINLTNFELLQEKSTIDTSSNVHLLIGCSNNMIFYDKYSHSKFIENRELVGHFDFSINFDNEIKVYLISENWVGIDCERVYIPPTLRERNAIQKKESEKKIKKPKANKKPLHIQNYVDAFFSNRKFPKPNKDITKVEKQKKRYLTDVAINSSTQRSQNDDSFKLTPESIFDKSIQQHTQKPEKKLRQQSIEESIKYLTPSRKIEDSSYLQNASFVSSNEYGTTFRKNQPVVSQSPQASQPERKQFRLKNIGSLANVKSVHPDASVSWDNSNDNMAQRVSEFKYTPKKKISTYELSLRQQEDLNNYKKARLESGTEDNQKKLTWRSPLLISSPVVFSPKLSERFAGSQQSLYNWNETNMTSTKENRICSTAVSSHNSAIEETKINERRNKRPNLRDNVQSSICDLPISDKGHSQTLNELSSSAEGDVSPSTSFLLSSSFLEPVDFRDRTRNPCKIKRPTTEKPKITVASYYFELMKNSQSSQSDKPKLDFTRVTQVEELPKPAPENDSNVYLNLIESNIEGNEFELNKLNASQQSFDLFNDSDNFVYSNSNEFSTPIEYNNNPQTSNSRIANEEYMSFSDNLSFGSELEINLTASAMDSSGLQISDLDFQCEPPRQPQFFEINSINLPVAHSIRSPPRYPTSNFCGVNNSSQPNRWEPNNNLMFDRSNVYAGEAFRPRGQSQRSNLNQCTCCSSSRVVEKSRNRQIGDNYDAFLRDELSDFVDYERPSTSFSNRINDLGFIQPNSTNEANEFGSMDYMDVDFEADFFSN